VAAATSVVPATGTMPTKEEAGEEHRRNDKKRSRDDGHPGGYLIEPIRPIRHDYRSRGQRSERSNRTCCEFIAGLGRFGRTVIFGHVTILNPIHLYAIGAGYECPMNALADFLAN
jgi:hypothetical protein